MHSPRGARLTYLALITVGLIVGGTFAAVLASMGTGGVSVNLAGPPDETFTIQMENTNFLTSEIDASLGDNILVIIENLDPGLHDFIIEEFDVAVENGAGETSVAAFTADRAGTFPFYCSVPGHREAGMEGIVRI